MDAGQYSPPPPRNSNTGRILIACCGCASLAAVFAVVGIYMLFQSGSKVLTQSQGQADAFLTAMEHRDFKRAQQLMSGRAQGVTGTKKLADIIDMLEGQHGKAIAHSRLPSFYMNNKNGRAEVQLAFTMKFERGSTTVAMVMVLERGKWLVQSFNFQL